MFFTLLQIRAEGVVKYEFFLFCSPCCFAWQRERTLRTEGMARKVHVRRMLAAAQESQEQFL
jgi:hypothetical protein